MSTTIGPQREEEHACHPLLNWRQVGICRGLVRQQPTISRASVAVIDVSESADALEQLRLHCRARPGPETGVATQPGPGVLATSENVGELDARLLQKGCKILVTVRPELGDNLLPSVRELRTNVLQHDRLRLLVHDDLATGW